MKPFNENNTQALDFQFNQALHGDVIIEKIEKLPKNFESLRNEPNSALAYGEATGHLHKLFRFGEETGSAAFALKITDDGVKYLKVDEPTVLKHQEHEPRVIPPGIYRIGIQREYDPFTKKMRSVAD